MWERICGEWKWARILPAATIPVTVSCHRRTLTECLRCCTDFIKRKCVFSGTTASCIADLSFKVRICRSRCPPLKCWVGILGSGWGHFPPCRLFSHHIISIMGFPSLRGEKIPSSALPPRRIESTASISGLISSMIPMATIPRFRSCGQIAVSVIGSTMLVPDGSDGTYFSDGKPDMMRPTSTGARSN